MQIISHFSSSKEATEGRLLGRYLEGIELEVFTEMPVETVGKI
jgi:hypothetical protein